MRLVRTTRGPSSEIGNKLSGSDRKSRGPDSEV
jgi:hypothetical protein